MAASAESARTILAKKLSDDNVLDDIAISEGKAKSNKDGLAQAANESAVCAAIDKLLKQGHSPAKIAAVLEKYAELNLWNKQFSTDYLNRRVNDLGMGYIQPNQFMPKKPDTYESKKPKLGADPESSLGVADFIFENHGTITLLTPLTRAANAWVSENIGKDNGYQPYWPQVVIEPRYADDILNGIGEAGMSVEVGGRSRTGSVHIAVEGEDLLGLNDSKFGGQPAVQRRSVEVKVADRDEGPAGNVPLMARVPADQPVAIRGAADAVKTATIRDRGVDFDSGAVAEQRLAGKPFAQIWREACQTVGLHRASKAFNEYVNAAKRAGTKFEATDVELLSHARP